MRQTGLEVKDGLLQSFNVDATNEQILTFMIPTAQGWAVDKSPEFVWLLPNVEALESRQPLALNFQLAEFRWYQAREVKPMASKPNLRAEVVFSAAGQLWTETDMTAKPTDQFQRFLSDSAERRRRVHEGMLPAVVTVSEAAPMNPHAFSQSAQEQTPRLVVIGSSEMMTGNVGRTEMDFIRGSIDWCRKRESNIGIQPKSHNEYVLPKTVKESRLLWLPMLLILLSVAGLGLVVWNVRRR
jgi:hypothetical protein